MGKMSTEEDYIYLFTPVSADDFWNTKSLLASGEVPFKVKGKFSPAYYIGPRFEFDIQSEIFVKNEDRDRATLLRNEFIKKSEERARKAKEYGPTMMDKFKDFFRYFNKHSNLTKRSG